MVRRLQRLTLLAALGIAWPAVGRGMQQASPQRLQLSIERSTLDGAETHVNVTLLDRAYHVVPSDQDRVVSLEQSAAGPGQPGAGAMSPASLRIFRGAGERPRVAAAHSDAPSRPSKGS